MLPSPYQTRRSAPLRDLKGIEDQLRLLQGNPGLQRLADHTQDDGDVYRLLEDLRETTSVYQVCLSPRHPHPY